MDYFFLADIVEWPDIFEATQFKLARATGGDWRSRRILFCDGRRIEDNGIEVSVGGAGL